MKERTDKVVQPRRGIRRGCAIGLLVCVAIVVFFSESLFLLGSTLVGFSGTRVPEQAKALSREERREQTMTRARTILSAIHAHREKHGRLPSALDELVPEFLASVPAPLTSTMPFRYATKDAGKKFEVSWEMYPNAMYQREWLDQDGASHVDM